MNFPLDMPLLCLIQGNIFYLYNEKKVRGRIVDKNSIFSNIILFIFRKLCLLGVKGVKWPSATEVKDDTFAVE